MNLLDDISQAAILFKIIPGLVPSRFQSLHLVRGEPEQEKVFSPDLFTDFDVRAVERANGQRAVESKLHVARSGGFLAGSRNLLRKVGRRIDPLRIRDVKIGEEDDTQAAADRRIIIYHLRNRVDQLDDQLGHKITRGSFSAKNKSARRNCEFRILPEAIVQIDDMEYVQMLPFVL